MKLIMQKVKKIRLSPTTDEELNVGYNLRYSAVYKHYRYTTIRCFRDP
jgi:hypothetical protein